MISPKGIRMYFHAFINLTQKEVIYMKRNIRSSHTNEISAVFATLKTTHKPRTVQQMGSSNVTELSRQK
jgi:hypothetical protein